MWTLLGGIIAMLASGFLAGVMFFAFFLFDREINISAGPAYIMVFFVVRAVGGLVSAFRGKLPGTKGRPE